MRSYKLTGVVLKNKDLGEVDGIVTLFTKEIGKISLKAKGVRKIKSKLSGHLMPLNITFIQAVQGKGSLDTITGAVSKEHFSSLKGDLKFLSFAYFFLEIIDKLTFEKEPSEKIYDLLIKGLQLLDSKNIEKPEILKTAFSYNLIKILGHKPKIDSCVKCSIPFNLESKKIGFDLNLGGAVCKSCNELNNKDTLPVSFDSLKVINAFDKCDLKDISRLIMKEKYFREALKIINSFNYYIFEKDYKSENLIEIIKTF
ncbi:MAG: DNA repair protein RecO [Patescibacteria group bacterium]|nr:DNA repair protein RecO [Patescibacteria group bacterium]